jgi:serine/threonine protein phosphatase PrpC
LILDTGCATHPGKTDRNSDVYSLVQHWVTDTQLAEKGQLYLLADDISPRRDDTSHHKAQDSSEAANRRDAIARHAVNRLYQLYYTYPSDNIQASLTAAMERVNTELYEEGKRNQRENRVALLAAVIQGNHLYLGNVGQSRAYLYHKGRLEQLTTDKSWEEILPPPDPESEEIPPGYCLGYGPQTRLDFSSHRFTLGDILLLSSDGLYDTLDDSDLQKVAEPPLAASEMAEALLDRANQAGHADSATAVVIMATAKGPERGALPRLASWASWALAGVLIVIVTASLLTWAGSWSPGESTVIPSPSFTETRQRVETTSLPAILRPTLTATPTWISTATSAPGPILTRPSVPSATPAPATETTTPAPELEPAPTPIAPYEEEAIYQQENSVLVWQWYRRVSPNELYEIRIWREGTEPPERGNIRTGQRQYDFGLPLDQTGKHYWDVRVIRETDDQESMIISLPSEQRSFWWMGPRVQPDTPTPGPTSTPLPPTATSIPPTSTPVPPTSTPVPPTNTPVPSPTPLP